MQRSPREALTAANLITTIVPVVILAGALLIAALTERIRARRASGPRRDGTTRRP